MYSIKVKKEIRGKLIKFLNKHKIDTRLSFPPVHIQPYYVKNSNLKETNFLMPLTHMTVLLIYLFGMA